MARQRRLDVDGRGVKRTNLDKVLYPRRARVKGRRSCSTTLAVAPPHEVSCRCCATGR